MSQFLLEATSSRLSLDEVASATAELNQGSLKIAAACVDREPFIGRVIPSVGAVDWARSHDVDIRPRHVDSATGEVRLVDSGSQITVTKKKPDDKVDNNIRLVAVNGSKIETYGVRKVQVKINRKQYEMPAVVCDVEQDILGFDFLDKFKLGFEWDGVDQSQLFLVDKVAQIRSKLQIMTVPKNLARINYLEVPQDVQVPPDLAADRVRVKPKPSMNSQLIAFQVACMKALDKEEESKALKLEDQLAVHDPKYVQLMKKYPKLLNPSFIKGEPVHGVFHKIETGSHPPCKSKKRPIIANAAKAEAGKKAWLQMEADGIIERVPPGTPIEWSSALHLADKPSGGTRPCSDFRLLNQKTELNTYPLPILRDFTSQIHGASFFSVVDLRSAFSIFRFGRLTGSRRPPSTPGEEYTGTTGCHLVWRQGLVHGRLCLSTF